MKLSAKAFGIYEDAEMKKYAVPVIMLVVFETVAITLWLTKGNVFYLFNFSYIGISVSLGIFLFINIHQSKNPIILLFSFLIFVASVADFA